MITPHKYLDLNMSLVFLGSIVLVILKEERIIKYNELQEKVISATSENAKNLYNPALSFLYILGKIEYHRDIDSIELIA